MDLLSVAGRAVPGIARVHAQVRHARFTAEGHRIRLINLSVTGARIRDIAGQQLPQLAALGRPALVTVLGGANDMFPRSRRADAVGQFAALVDQLPAGRSVIATLPRRNAQALSMNALIDGAAASGKVRIAEMRGMTVRSLIGTRAEDHFHPNERGYARITAAFDQAIDRACLLA